MDYLIKNSQEGLYELGKGDIPNSVPFSGVNRLEVEIDEYSVSNKNIEIDKAGIICVYFLCGLPFDC